MERWSDQSGDLVMSGNRLPIELAHADVGGPLSLSVSFGRSHRSDEAGFRIEFPESVDGDYPYIQHNFERYRNLADALVAFADRATSGRPWMCHYSRTANEMLDDGPSLSVPADALKVLISEIEARYPIDKEPEAFYGAKFAADLARTTISFQMSTFIDRLPRMLPIRDTAMIDPEHFMEMAIVDTPAGIDIEPTRTGKIIRVRSVTAVPSADGEGYRIETENGVEYFHDIHLANLAFEGRAAELQDSPSGFGMQLDEDGGRNELKDTLMGINCASVSEYTVARLVERARKEGIDRRMPEIVDMFDELRAVAYGVPDLVADARVAR
jgi:hypothetical protein